MRKNFVAQIVAVAVGVATFLSAPSMGSSSAHLKKGLDLVILVDESSSLSSSDVQAEIRAVISLIARRELSGENTITQVAIAGFGSGVAAVDEKCAPTFVTIDNVFDLIICAQKVRRRSSTGQHTDFAMAFKYASATFEKMENINSSRFVELRRAVILLTDGKYDPDGKRDSSGLTAEDILALNESTAALRKDDAQIWPLGFGKAEEDELNDLARSGAKARCKKVSDPYAIIADDNTLDASLLKILGAVLCVGVVPPIPIGPIYVHAFVNEVVLTVRGITDEPDVFVDATKKVLCVGDWKLAKDGSQSCIVKVAGADVGKWEISSSQEGTLETSQSGRVDLRLSDCKDSSATVSVSRIDGTEILWNLSYELGFPRAVVVDTANRKEIGSILLTSDDNQVTLSKSGSALKELEVSLAIDLPEGKQYNFDWLTASPGSCEVVVSPPATSLVPTSLVTIPEVTVPEPPDSGPPWLLILLGFALLLGLGWYLRRRSRNGKFPYGAEFQQRNVARNPAAKWNTRADLSGLREVFFIVDRNSWLVEASKEDANLTVRKLGSKAEDAFDIVQTPTGAGQGEAEQGVRSTHAFSYADDLGSGINFRDTFIRVVVPEDLEDEDNDEEQ